VRRPEAGEAIQCNRYNEEKLLFFTPCNHTLDHHSLVRLHDDGVTLSILLDCHVAALPAMTAGKLSNCRCGCNLHDTGGILQNRPFVDGNK